MEERLAKLEQDSEWWIDWKKNRARKTERVAEHNVSSNEDKERNSLETTPNGATNERETIQSF